LGKPGWALLCALLLLARAEAFPYKGTGQATAIAMPVVAGGIAVYHEDWDGLVQLTVVTGLSYATAYGLKHLVRSCRPFAKPCGPDSSNWDSFPSTTSALSSAPSSFVWRRYGWEWGLPMFVISKYPSFAMGRAKQNKIWDGLASTAISWGWNRLITTRWHKPYDDYSERGFYSDVDGDSKGVYAQLGYRF